MKKVLWIGGIIIGVIAILITLIFTLFTLKTTEIKFHNNTTIFQSEEIQENILETAEFNYGKTVIFHNKQNYVDKLEKNYPYIKVINIETVFPNKFIVHCVEREPVFAVKFDGGYYFCDKDLKILELFTENFESTQTNYIKISPLTQIENTFEVGDFLTIPETQILKQISPSFELTNHNIYDQMALIKEIKVVLDDYNPQNPLNENSIGIELYDFANLKTHIVGADRKLTEKINYFCNYQTKIQSPQTHYLLIWETSSNEIQAIEKVN